MPRRRRRGTRRRQRTASSARLPRAPGPSIARRCARRSLSGPSPRSRSIGLRRSCAARLSQLGELRAQLLELRIERVHFVAARQAEGAHQGLGVAALLDEQRRGGVRELRLQAAELLLAPGGGGAEARARAGGARGGEPWARRLGALQPLLELPGERAGERRPVRRRAGRAGPRQAEALQQLEEALGRSGEGQIGLEGGAHEGVLHGYIRCGKSKVRGSRRRQITDGKQRRKALASSPRIATGSVNAVIVRCIHRDYPLRAENRARPAERAVNMAEERLIRKYANRRLYDAEESRHVTLDDLRKLIASGQRIKVIDDKSGEDITRGVLL